MGQTVVFAVGGGILSAMLFLSAAFGSPGALITTYLSPLPLFLVGLSLGATGSVVAGIVGAVGIVLVLGPTEMAAFAAGGAMHDLAPRLARRAAVQTERSRRPMLREDGEVHRRLHSS